MTDPTAHQIEHLLRLQDAHEQRLRVLVVQAAQTGRSTPAEAIVEVREIQNKILSLAGEIGKLQTSATQAEHREHVAVNTSDLSDVSLQLSSSTEIIRKWQQTTLEQLINWFDSDKLARGQRQRTTTLFYCAVLIMLAIDILVRFWK